MDLDVLAARNLARTEAKNRTTFRHQVRLALLRMYAAMMPAPRAELTGLPDDAHLLVIRPDHLGDVLFTTPALSLLRAALPRAHITAMVGPWADRILQGDPAVDSVLTCAFPGFTRQPKGSVWSPYVELNDYAKKLHSWRFDAALVLRRDHWWGALLAYRARIPRRIGANHPAVAPFLTAALDHTASGHEVLHNISLIRFLTPAQAPVGQELDMADLPLAFNLTEQDHAFAAAVLHEDSAWIAIHPGAGAPVKRWRPHAWAQVISALAHETGARILLTGSAHEAVLCNEIAAQLEPSPLILAGQTDLGGLAAIYARCRLVMGPDSGPLHLATAMGTPTIHLFGPADPASFGPWGDPARHRIVTLGIGCSPCRHLDWPEAELANHPCIWAIPVEHVLDAARALLMIREV
jgi:heptosyltransferase-2/heptosyltransferase-3